MTGYVRQSAADIVPTAVVRSAPVNAEFNALRDAFALSGGHKHDGSSTEGAYVPLIADVDANNKVVINTNQNRVEFYSEVSSAPAAQLYIQDGVILPVVDNDVDLGSSSFEFKDLYIDGVAYLDSVVADTADINAGTIDNTVIGGSTAAAGSFTTISTSGQATLTSVNIDGGTIDGTTIGASTPAAITGTTITASTQFTGDLVGNVTGNTAGTHTGAVVGDVTGNVVGNIIAVTGSSTFNNVTVNGTLDVTGTTIANVTDPVNAQDAATKNYVDTADALKLDLTGGTMSGAIAMGTNKITGLGAPTTSTDAATKGYVDTSVAAVIDAAPAALDTLNELAAALGDDANFSTTVTNSIATKLPLAGGTMTGAIEMGTNKITGLGNPTLAQDAATKTYVDTADALKLNLSGGTMSGAIAMGTNKITGLGDPTTNQDAATKVYVDTQDALKLNLTGGTMSGNIVMGANKVTSTATPTADDDLTRKAYVDSILGSATSAAASAAAAATSESNAATSETNAANSASAAATSEANAAASYDAFDDRYLGAKASAPSVDNDGNALLTGALYWNTTSNSLFIWTGSAWNAAAFDTSGALLAVNNLSDLTNAATARTNLGFDAAVDTHLNTSTATTGQALTWNGADYEWSTTGAINDIFYENSTTVSSDYTITSGKNAVSAGPVTIASGVTVTVPSGSRWAVV